MKKDIDILTIPQAATYCSVTRMTMWRWVKAGEIKVSVTAGGHHRILKEDLKAFLREKGMGLIADKHFPPNRILIVDDDPLVLQSLTILFSKNGYETETASDGFETGVKITQFNPDIMILDLVMPRMDGFEVCRFLKNNPEISHIKVLILTGYNTIENKEEAIRAGADAFMAKPVSNKALIQKTKDLLKDSRKGKRTAR
ncbi:MAG: response regulator [Deltaproteobacteria bacterium]|nr:response regulator [Deltaproteobacteria bacterium]